MNTYQFPRSKFADSNTIWKQFWHMASELFEVFRALLRRDYYHAAKEMADLKHSTETGEHILEEQYRVDVKAATKEVIRGNICRGYYPPDRNLGRYWL